MNLSDTLSSIANYYADALESCGRPVCAAFRYVGIAEMTGDGACDCTCDAGSDLSVEPLAGFPQGALRVGWRQIGPSDAPPQLKVLWQGQMAVPLVEVQVRVMRCWPTAKDTPLPDWDSAAAGLADDAWCLACAAQTLIACNTADARAKLGVEGCRNVGGYRLEPVLPDGGCAGTYLTMWAMLAAPC